jgi:hypothetical protein
MLHSISNHTEWLVICQVHCLNPKLAGVARTASHCGVEISCYNGSDKIAAGATAAGEAPTVGNCMARHHVGVGWMSKNKDKVRAGSRLDLTLQFGIPS